MIEVVLNKRYGGFSLSRQAFKEWCRREFEEQDYTIDEEWNIVTVYKLVSYEGVGEIVETDKKFSENEIPRTNKNLIDIVKEYGKEADGECAQLEIEKIDVSALISDHDGLERL